MYKTKVDEYGSILTQYRSPEALPAHNTTVDGYLWLVASSTFDARTTYWNGFNFVSREAPPTKWHLWAGAWVESPERKAIIQGQVMNNLRIMRNAKLNQCDWTQVPDAPLSETKVAEWATYRTSLRNATLANIGLTDLDLAVWPTEPN